MLDAVTLAALNGTLMANEATASEQERAAVLHHHREGVLAGFALTAKEITLGLTSRYVHYSSRANLERQYSTGC